MKLRIRSAPYRLPLRRSVRSGRGWISERTGHWLFVQDPDGRLGLGEVAPLPSLATESEEEAAQALRRLEGTWESRELPPLPGLPATSAALELALLDLEGQSKGLSIARLLSSEARERVPVNALLLEAAASALAEEAQRAVDSGYETLKIKVGGRPLAEDIERVARVRERVGGGIRLRLDANGSWDPETALAAADELEAFHIEYLEQPVLHDLKLVRDRSPIPIAADESVASLEAARALIASRSVDVIIVKPMAAGGLRAGLAIAAEARAAGLKAVVTSILDSGVGVSGALHLAAALPGPEVACGLATLHLFETMPVKGLAAPRNGVMELPAGPGLGVRLS